MLSPQLSLSKNLAYSVGRHTANGRTRQLLSDTRSSNGDALRMSDAQTHTHTLASKTRRAKKKLSRSAAIFFCLAAVVVVIIGYQGQARMAFCFPRALQFQGV